jgi:hypothetical protein
MRAFSPEGKPIVRVLESILATYGIVEDSFVAPPAEGTVGWDYDGAGAEINWDSAEPIVREGGMVFVDVDGEEWPFDKVVLREGPPDEIGEGG